MASIGNGAGGALSIVAREVQSTADPRELLQRIVEGSVATIGACDYAGVTTERAGRPTSTAVSHPTVDVVDNLQYATGRGPCLDAMRGDQTIVEAPDLEQDLRWGEFGARAAAEGVHSVLSHRLYVDAQRLGSLNLYATDRDVFSSDDRHRAEVISVLASLAMNALRLESDAGGLREALRSRDVIGQAKGIFMQRFRIDEDAAFDELRVISQRENRKLRDVATDVVRARLAVEATE